MNISLENKRAIVCGSTQGIGKAAAFELASLGATVTLIARNEEELKKTYTELPGTYSQKHEYICADFSRPDELKMKVDKYVSGKTIHILINNTGGPKGGPITEAKPEEFTATFSQHLVCNHILVQAVLGGMKKDKYGRIINIISTSVKQPIKGLGVSNTIRAAVANWAKTLAGEVARYGITVNNILPGSTDTQRLHSLFEAKAQRERKTVDTIKNEWLCEIPMERFASPEEIANAIAFLASPAASYITGINLPVDGGRTGNL
ncbi:MAG: SDR family oxidoreductase [Bacteroidia bacterium]|nr:SDR family oxidoreductase [Bacteroidia bacterium]